MSMTDDELKATVGTLSIALVESLNAVDRIKAALDLPFRPAVFQAVHDAQVQAANVLGGINRLIAERNAARDELAEIKSRAG